MCDFNLFTFFRRSIRQKFGRSSVQHMYESRDISKTSLFELLSIVHYWYFHPSCFNLYWLSYFKLNKKKKCLYDIYCMTLRTSFDRFQEQASSECGYLLFYQRKTNSWAWNCFSYKTKMFSAVSSSPLNILTLIVVLFNVILFNLEEVYSINTVVLSKKNRFKSLKLLFL